MHGNGQVSGSTRKRLLPNGTYPSLAFFDDIVITPGTDTNTLLLWCHVSQSVWVQSAATCLKSALLKIQRTSTSARPLPPLLVGCFTAVLGLMGCQFWSNNVPILEPPPKARSAVEVLFADFNHLLEF